MDEFGSIDQKTLFTEYKRISVEIIEYTNCLHVSQHRVEELENQNIELNRKNKLLTCQLQEFKRGSVIPGSNDTATIDAGRVTQLQEDIVRLNNAIRQRDQ